MQIDLADLKLYIGESDYTDPQLQQRANMAVAAINRYVGYDIFDNTEKDEYVNGAGERVIRLSRSPIIAIDSIEINNGTQTTENWVTVDPETYTSLGSSGQVVFTSGLVRGFQNYKVTYSGGYADDEFPEDILRCAYDLVSLYLNRSGSMGITSESIGGASVTYSKDEEKKILETLYAYKVFYV